MHYRAMRPDAALVQFRSLFDSAGKCRQLQCVDNVLPREYLQDVLPRLDTPGNMSIFYETKADLDEEDFEVTPSNRRGIFSWDFAESLRARTRSTSMIFRCCRTSRRHSECSRYASIGTAPPRCEVVRAGSSTVRVLPCSAGRYRATAIGAKAANCTHPSV
jgi:hypothetical protein